MMQKTNNHSSLLAKNKLFVLAAGLYFAVLQFCYFFLLEAFLSSQSYAFFIALFFWLVGFLAGLNLKNKKIYRILVVVSLAPYYLSYFLIQTYPFNSWLLPILGLCIALSGILPGYYFPLMLEKFSKVKTLLLHENNGFILGVLLSLVAADFAGMIYLLMAPFIGFLLLLMLGFNFIFNRQGRSQLNLGSLLP